MTTSRAGNPCSTCQHRWDSQDGHCYFWEFEPAVCNRWKPDHAEIHRQAFPPLVNMQQADQVGSFESPTGGNDVRHQD